MDTYNQTSIIQNRSAFILFLKNGIEEVEKYYPESVDFVNKYHDKTLKEITQILEDNLNQTNE